MDKNLKCIIDMMLQLSEKQTHPDKAACIHAVLMDVNMAIGREMLKIRQQEKSL